MLLFSKYVLLSVIKIMHRSAYILQFCSRVHCIAVTRSVLSGSNALVQHINWSVDNTLDMLQDAVVVEEVDHTVVEDMTRAAMAVVADMVAVAVVAEAMDVVVDTRSCMPT